MHFHNALSEDHFREDVRDVIKLSTGLIGTMAALVLGLLIASAKNSYDTKSTQIKQIATDIILLDLDLERYGPDAKNLRIALREAISPLIDRIWNEGDRARVSPFVALVFLLAADHLANVRYWHLADIWKPPMNVRFRG